MEVVGQQVVKKCRNRLLCWLLTVGGGGIWLSSLHPSGDLLLLAWVPATVPACSEVGLLPRKQLLCFLKYSTAAWGKKIFKKSELMLLLELASWLIFFFFFFFPNFH